MRIAATRMALAIAAALIACALPRAANAQQETPDQSAPAETGEDSELVVKGFLAPDRDLPVQVRPVYGQAFASRGSSADARMFVRCAHKPRASMLRQIVDGPANTRLTEFALDRYIRMNSACYSGYPPSLSPGAPYFGDCNPVLIDDTLEICRAYYDRGALVEYALHTYAPDLNLTPAQTLTAEARDRFLAREAIRGKQRLAADRLYFTVVACMVQYQPARAIRLLQAEPNSADEKRLRTLLVGLTPVCVANARNVQVDPIQFRFYVADAVYAWAVAVRGTDSLIPS